MGPNSGLKPHRIGSRQTGVNDELGMRNYATYFITVNILYCVCNIIWYYQREVIEMKNQSKRFLTILVPFILIAAALLGFFWKDIPFSKDLSLRGEVVAVYHPAASGASEGRFVIASEQFQSAPLHLNFKVDSTIPIKDQDGKEADVGAIKEGVFVDVTCTVNTSSDSDPTKLPALITPSSITITQKE